MNWKFQVKLFVVFLSLIFLSSCRLWTVTFFQNKLSEIGRPNYGIPWNPYVKYGVLKDPRDGHIYRTVTIDNQTWMAENLNHKVENSSCPAKSEDSCSKYGREYEWDVAMNIYPVRKTTSQPDPQTEGYDDNLYGYNAPKRFFWGGSDSLHQGVCPVGWHIPSYKEWNILFRCVLGKSSVGKNTDSVLTFRLTPPKGWITLSSMDGKVNYLRTDDFGFRVLPSPDFGNKSEAIILSATELTTTSYPMERVLHFSRGWESVLNYNWKSVPVSVRCVENN